MSWVSKNKSLIPSIKIISPGICLVLGSVINMNVSKMIKKKQIGQTIINAYLSIECRIKLWYFEDNEVYVFLRL